MMSKYFNSNLTTIPISNYVAYTDFSILVPLRFFINFRWMILFIELIGVGSAYFIFDCNFQVGALSVLINSSFIVNGLLHLSNSAETRLTHKEVPYFLIYDLGQLITLFYMTGGLHNPFSILILVPLVIAAAILPTKPVLTLCAFVMLSLILLAFSPYPLFWKINSEKNPVRLPFIFSIEAGVALGAAIVFLTFYVWTFAQKTSQLNKALRAMQHALAREQKISSLGALAAAAAHELGSPLNTISLVANDILSVLPQNSPLLEDVHLLISQSNRCREILIQLSQDASLDHEHTVKKIALSELIETSAKSYQLPAIRLTIHKKSLDPEPCLQATPDLLHGIGNIIQNAFQFAISEVKVTLKWNRQHIEMTIQDNGPGYPPGQLPYLGQPYSKKVLSSPDKSQVKHIRKGQNLGLGLFIAQTLLSQHKAQVHFYNDGGACCLIRWPRNFKIKGPET